MPIRWNAALVAEKCDEAERLLAPAIPIAQRAARALKDILEMDNIPQYMRGPAGGAESAAKNVISRVKSEIDRIRADIPEKEMAKSRYRGRAVTLNIPDERVHNSNVPVLVKVAPQEYDPRRPYVAPAIPDRQMQLQIAG